MSKQTLTESYTLGFRAETWDGQMVMCDLLYPRSEGHANSLQIGMECVRATDGFRTHYDFERDGWVILQQEAVHDANGTHVAEGDWREVCFLQSWALSSEEGSPEAEQIIAKDTARRSPSPEP